MQKLMPRHSSFLLAIHNRAIELRLEDEHDMDVKFNDQVPNMETSRDPAWMQLDKAVKADLADSKVGLFRYSYNKTETFSIDSHRAAVALTTAGTWVRRPRPPKPVEEVTDNAVKTEDNMKEAIEATTEGERDTNLDQAATQIQALKDELEEQKKKGAIAQ